MSRKTRRNQVNPQQPGAPADGPPAAPTNRRGIIVGVVVALALAVVGGGFLYKYQEHEAPDPAIEQARQAALASDHSPTIGDPGAGVHIVEFLDPACETCAAFYPLVKQWMVQNPGRIRLSIRHVAFHRGADYVIRILEASRKQDRYWQTLEALLATQHLWVPNHVVQPESVLPALAGVDLDMERLTADMNAPEVGQRMERDRSDAITLKVAATPEYFVNGRPLPSFGQQQLQGLVQEELNKAY